MTGYHDGGGRLLSDTAFAWLDQHLATATAFAVQTGYISWGGYQLLETGLRQIIANGGSVEIVVGAGNGQLDLFDLLAIEQSLEAVGGPGTFDIHVVTPLDVLFHPKTYWIQDGGGHASALVGSSNFTRGGLGENVEASVSVVSPDLTVAAVRAAITAVQNHPGTDRFTSAAVQSLLSKGAGGAGTASGKKYAVGNKKGTSTLGKVSGLPASQPRPAVVAAVPAGTTSPPAMGLFKRLSKANDLKGFNQTAGTAYVSLAGKNHPLITAIPWVSTVGGNPRFSGAALVRLDSAPTKSDQRFFSAGANLMRYGAAPGSPSKPDLRLGLAQDAFNELLLIAAAKKLKVPAAGDYIAVEIDLALLRFSITFVTDPTTVAELDAKRVEGRAWGWLSPGDLPPW